MRNIIFLALGLLVGLEKVNAGAVDINLNNNSARFTLITGTTASTETEFSYLYNEDEYKLPHIGLHIIDQTGDRTNGLLVALGGRIYALYKDPIEVFAVGLGGALIFTPEQAFGRVRVRLQAHIAPNIVSFRDADGLSEYAIALEYQILSRGFVYLGYRSIKIDLSNSSTVNVDEGAHLGLRIQY